MGQSEAINQKPINQSEAIHRRRTDHTMVKRKRTNIGLKNTTQKLKIEQHEPH
jgi:hypothetical protein